MLLLLCLLWGRLWTELSHSSSEWDFSKGECIVLECAHLGYSWLKMMKPEKQNDARKWVEWSFPEISFSRSLTCSSPPYSHGHKQPVWSGFRFACCWSHHRWLIVPPSKPLFGLLPLSVTLSFFRKCWTSAKTEGAVKSLSTAACLGQTSVLAAVNTSLSGTNADLVSPSSPQILTVTHISVFFLFSHTLPHSVQNTPVHLHWRQTELQH